MILFILCLLFAFSNAVQIGVMYSGSGPTAVYGLSQKYLAGEWAKWENTKGLYLTRGLNVNIEYFDIQGLPTLVAPGVKYLIEQRNVSAIIAPEGDFSTLAAQAANPYNILVISGMSATDYNFMNLTTGQRLYSNFIGTMTPASQYNINSYSLFSFSGASTMILIYTNTDFFKILSLQSLNSIYDNNFKILNYYVLSPGAATNVTQESLELTTILQDVATNYPEVDILTFATEYSCQTIPSILKAFDYTPKGIIVWECLNSIDSFNNKEDLRYFTVPSQWSSGLRGSSFTDGVRPYADMFPEIQPNINDQIDALMNHTELSYVTMPSPLQFVSWYNNQTLYPMTSISCSSLAAFYVLSYALYFDPTQLLNYAHRAKIASFYGVISIDSNGLNSKDMVVLQTNLDGNLEIIYPQTARNSTSIIYPIPKWSERINSYTYISEPYEHVILGFVIGFSIVYFLIALALFKNRNEKRIKAASVKLMMIVLLGCLLGTCTPLTWLKNDTSSGCDYRFPLILFATTFTQITIIFKSYRLYRIFNMRDYGKKIYTDNELLGWIFIVFACVLTYIFIWSYASPNYLAVEVVDNYRPVYNYMTCFYTYSNRESIFEIIFLTYILILTCFTFYFAKRLDSIETELKTSNYNYSDFQETRPIIVSLLIQSFGVIIILILLEFQNNSNRDVVIILRSFIFMFVYLLTALIMCGYRLVDVAQSSVHVYTQTIAANNNSISNDSKRVSIIVTPTKPVSPTKPISPKVAFT